jgi:hypothetical protein
MHDQDFCSSFQPDPATVFGVRLETFAIGHELALIRQGNPLVTMGEASFEELDRDARKLALAMALEICGRVGFLRRWKVVVAIYRAKPEGLAGEIKDFRDYRSAGSRDLPLAKMPKQHGVPWRYFGAPALASLLNYVTERHELLIKTHFGGSPLNFPLGLAQILYSTHLEGAGMVWVKNAQEMEVKGDPTKAGNEKIYAGDEADKVFAEATAKAVESKGRK